jgi:hypothetical protein
LWSCGSSVPTNKAKGLGGCHPIGVEVVIISKITRQVSIWSYLETWLACEN